MSFAKRYSKQLIGASGFVGLIVFWQVAGFLTILPKFVLPTPLEIVAAFIRDPSSCLNRACIGDCAGCYLGNSDG